MSRPHDSLLPLVTYFPCVVLLLVGWMGSVFGALALRGDPDGPAGLVGWARGDAALLAGAGVAASVAGAVGAALSPRPNRHDTIVVVSSVMCPVPGALAWSFNGAGHHVRSADAPLARAALAGAGVFLLALAASWLAAGFHLRATAFHWRGVLWPVAIQLGLSLLAVALLPRRGANPESLELVELTPERPE